MYLYTHNKIQCKEPLPFKLYCVRRTFNKYLPHTCMCVALHQDNHFGLLSLEGLIHVYDFGRPNNISQVTYVYRETLYAYNIPRLNFNIWPFLTNKKKIRRRFFIIGKYTCYKINVTKFDSKTIAQKIAMYIYKCLERSNYFGFNACT